LTLAGISPIIFSLMKSKHFLFLLAAPVLFAGCRTPRPALVPEISPPLVQEVVCSWMGNVAGDVIFPCAGGIGWVDAAGRVVAWNAAKKSAATVLELSFRVADPPFCRPPFLVLRRPQGDRLLVVDLEGPRVLAALDGLKAASLLGVDRDSLVYLEEDGRLAVSLWQKPGAVFRAAAGGDKFFDCHFSPERILVLGRERLHTFWKKTGVFESEPLPQPAASPFFFESGSVYYGSTRRCLVKYAIGQKRPDWVLELGQVLERRPFAFAGDIVASPADQSVLLVNERGSIVWWQALRSTMSCDLLPMSENLAAVLMNREIKFIDPLHRQVTVFQGAARPLGPPLALAGDLYFLAREEGQAYRLLRVGNRYGIDIELEPGLVHWVGTSLRFSVQTRHLLDPLWECEIVDAQGRPIFISRMTGAEKASLVWVPLQAGKYIIRVRAKALNRDALGEVPLQVLDPLQVMPGFYLHL
jgi:hypothetical protein